MNLPREIEVAVRIFEYNQRCESVWVSKLIGDLQEDGALLLKCVDQLLDLRVVSGCWTEIDGEWVRTLHITQDSMGLISAIAEKCHFGTF